MPAGLYQLWGAWGCCLVLPCSHIPLCPAPNCLLHTTSVRRYYHFVEEALPRVALLAKSGRLTSDVKLLTWGQPYEYEASGGGRGGEVGKEKEPA